MAASARARLVAFAAQQWLLSPSVLRVEAGVVIAPDGRSATYGSLTVGAATLPLPNAQPKDPSQYKIIGAFTGRLDARDIVTGKKKFTLDQAVPNAKPTMLRMPSQIRGKVVSVNNVAAVKAMPGVIDVVVVPPGGAIDAGRRPSGRAGGREGEAECDREADEHPDHPGAPRGDIDRAEGLLAMGVVVVPVVLAVVIGRVVGDGARVAGRIEVAVLAAHRRHSGRDRGRSWDVDSAV